MDIDADGAPGMPEVHHAVHVEVFDVTAHNEPVLHEDRTSANPLRYVPKLTVSFFCDGTGHRVGSLEAVRFEVGIVGFHPLRRKGFIYEPEGTNRRKLVSGRIDAVLREHLAVLADVRNGVIVGHVEEAAVDDCVH